MPIQREYSSPFIYLILVLPFGISGGFIGVTLPFLLVKNGFSVAAAAAVTALAVSSNVLRFLWGPMTDLTLTLHKWYIIGVLFCSFALSLFCFIPLTLSFKAIIMTLAFVSQIAAALVVSPVGGFMAKTVKKERKGMASGCFQAASLGGFGIGGGVGLWLSIHLSYQVAIIVLIFAMLFCSFALYWVPQVKAVSDKKILERMKLIGVDIKELIHSPVSLFSSIIIFTPIGVGAAQCLWSSVAKDWHVSPDLVALITGTMFGIASGIGGLFGGYISDKFGRWMAYFGSGAALAVITLFMGIFSFVQSSYIIGVLAYGFMCGVNCAAYSAIILHAIGHGLAATKFALLSSVGNIPLAYMIAIDGWLHDYAGIKMMLFGETLIGFFFILIFLLIMKHYKIHKMNEITY
ncbi:MFS transporter [uncultured Bacteroides sp.]|uniref:MFS transporter n=1 Tax=uncultured Bacteroides sp. TaxID=162156 RepID=UPI002AA63909|nr:MFS transporter [uncultured Bacteroides sp.]